KERLSASKISGGGVEKWIQVTVLKRLGTVIYLIQEGQRQCTAQQHVTTAKNCWETSS
ncbi:Hypothetical predicted protein, partial [Scomber scombrus]